MTPKISSTASGCHGSSTPRSDTRSSSCNGSCRVLSVPLICANPSATAFRRQAVARAALSEVCFSRSRDLTETIKSRAGLRCPVLDHPLGNPASLRRFRISLDRGDER